MRPPEQPLRGFCLAREAAVAEVHEPSNALGQSLCVAMAWVGSKISQHNAEIRNHQQQAEIITATSALLEHIWQKCCSLAILLLSAQVVMLA